MCDRVQGRWELIVRKDGFSWELESGTCSACLLEELKLIWLEFFEAGYSIHSPDALSLQVSQGNDLRTYRVVQV